MSHTPHDVQNSLIGPEELLGVVWDRSPVAMALSDPEGTVVAANPAYYELYQLGPADVLGRPFAVIFPEEQRAWALEQYREIFADEHAPPRYESAVVRGDGTRRLVESQIAFVSRDGARAAMLSLVRDVTEQRTAEAATAVALGEAQRAREVAQEAVRVRDAFLAVGVHELRNPLAALIGQVQLLQRRLAQGDAPGERVQRGLAAVGQQAARLSALVGAMLDVASLESGQLSVQLAPLDLAALARQVVEEQRAERAAPLLLELPGGPLPVMGDEGRLRQVLLNLLDNAAKYSPAGAEVQVRLAREGAEARLDVTDRGFGIPAAAIPSLFQRFFRADNAAARASGLGIGLYVVREVVTRHGGSVAVESAEGAGSTFTVRLPLWAEGETR